MVVVKAARLRLRLRLLPPPPPLLQQPLTQSFTVTMATAPAAFQVAGLSQWCSCYLSQLTPHSYKPCLLLQLLQAAITATDCISAPIIATAVTVVVLAVASLST